MTRKKGWTDRNAVPESLGYSVQEEQEGGPERGRRKIYMDMSDIERGGVGWECQEGGDIRNLTTTGVNKWREWGEVRQTINRTSILLLLRIGRKKVSDPRPRRIRGVGGYNGVSPDGMEYRYSDHRQQAAVSILPVGTNRKREVGHGERSVFSP